jgi:hypothetical protein
MCNKTRQMNNSSEHGRCGGQRSNANGWFAKKRGACGKKTEQVENAANNGTMVDSAVQPTMEAKSEVPPPYTDGGKDSKFLAEKV